jgi:hypothetical protein
MNQQSEPEPSLVIESTDAIDFLRSQGYGELLDAAAATSAANGRINKSAIARLLNLTMDVVGQELADMQELLQQ